MSKSIKNIICLIIVISLALSLNTTYSKDYSSIISKIESQLLKKINIFDGRWPKYTEDGKYIFRKNVNWFSGFAAGELWLMNELTANQKLKDEAIKISDELIKHADIDYTHDMGFIFIHSLVKAYKRTGDHKYKDAALTAARMLAKRFNENGNFIRAWGKLGSDDRPGLMIIDTMLNIELLFWAAAEFGLPEMYDIAYKHAITCLNEHVRNDFSSFHVVKYNPNTGIIEKKYTHQGFADSSTWARGQAWGIYGFAQTYQNTGDERFLNASKKMADYFLSKLPDDMVPYWDLDLSGEDVIKDASAAAIAASGMNLLAEVCDSRNDYTKYINASDEITKSLIENYTFLNSSREYEEGILIHTVYNYHSKYAVNESFPCGDFYFIEALHKFIKRHSSISQQEGSLRSKINLNENWFYLEDNANYDKISKSSVEWKLVDLPHSWNKFDAVDQEPGYRRDASWYEKTLVINEKDPEKIYQLHFEAVNVKCELYVNEKYVGRHIGGYIGFTFDISKFLVAGENRILVRADNSIDRSVIPSQKSDFFIYGGITRDVWLNILPKENIDELKITTINVDSNNAEVEISFSVDNFQSDGEVKINLINPEGKSVVEITKEISQQNKILLPSITNPLLWSTKEPNLYTLEVALFNDGKEGDRISEKYGLRWFEFAEYGPFYLNGERLKLRGTHRHEEYAGLANALSNELHRKDIEMIKEMGANFIRLAHYPQDPEIYRACDELGLLVWDELPWCRGGVGDQVWQENTKRLFREQIDQNYNHPSIIIWSIGNEVYWLPDYKDGDNIEKLRSFANELNDIAHEMDTNRVTSVRKFYEGADIVDVFSPSIWAGWYSGVYKSYDRAIDDAINKYPKFLHAEYGGSSHFGRHAEFPITGDGDLNPDEWSEAVNQVKVKNIAKIGDWSESYIVDLFDWHLMVSESKDNFTGNVQWAFKDFGTPLRPENALPYMNQKGLVDREGNPKDAYYVFKSYWNTEDKFVYIESHSWTERYGPEGVLREVNVFSNCDQVELIVNSKSQGQHIKELTKFPASGLSWNVEFVPGQNEIIAIGFSNKGLIKDTLYIEYSNQKYSKPERIVLSQKRLPNANYLITASVVDNSGNVCPDFNERVYFSKSGSGKLISNQGTYTKSDVIEFANGKASIEFKDVPFEKTIIEARTQDFKGSYLEIN